MLVLRVLAKGYGWVRHLFRTKGDRWFFSFSWYLQAGESKQFLFSWVSECRWVPIVWHFLWVPNVEGGCLLFVVLLFFLRAGTLSEVSGFVKGACAEFDMRISPAKGIRSRSGAQASLRKGLDLRAMVRRSQSVSGGSAG